MGKIQVLGLSKLHTEESFGFLKMVMDELSLVETPPEGMDTNTIVKAYTAFDDALKSANFLPSATRMKESDERRDRAWYGLHLYINALSPWHPAAEVREKAAEVRAILNKYGDPRDKTQTEESGILHNLLQDLHGLPEESRKAIALDAWVEELDAAEMAYQRSVSDRSVEEAQRVTGVVKQTRQEAEVAYRNLVEYVNAYLMLNPSHKELDTFAAHLNVLIDRQKVVLKQRATVNAKKSKKDEEQA